MTAKEMAYRQLIAGPAVDLHGQQAQALLAEMMKLRAELNNEHSIGAAQRSTATPAATLGAGAGTSASTSALPPLLLPRSAPSIPTVLVEMLEQRKDHRRKQLADYWKQVQNFSATCPMTNLVERQKAYNTYLAAFTQFEIDFPPETPPVSTTRCRRETDAAGVGVRFHLPTGQSAGPAVQQ